MIRARGTIRSLAGGPPSSALVSSNTYKDLQLRSYEPKKPLGVCMHLCVFTDDGIGSEKAGEASHDLRLSSRRTKR